ncbi:MAG: 70-kilodalton heat shock protein [Chaenotheca gracillima]|nr:MAG: 70-kilodalton heat shock protein [Chaenotheca gracillima]
MPEQDAEGVGESSPPHIDVDAWLPVNLDPEARAQAHQFLSSEDRNGSGRRRPADVRTLKLGNSIVNSVTIHRSPSDQDHDREGPVAVLTNNDKTVRVYSLTQNRLLTTLAFPFCMNHASISPDGKVLVAVGDDPYVFFYERVRKSSKDSAKERAANQSSLSSYDWELLSKYRLTPALNPANDGCFSSAFSSSGQYCAVASQDGVVTVFEMSYLGDSDLDPIIEIMPSSRPQTFSGAVRSICFSPQPWDLLICTEQAGRVCVTDVRAGFRSRQTIELDLESAENVELALDVAPEHSIDPRLRGAGIFDFLSHHRDLLLSPDEATAARASADHIRSLVAGDYSPQPLTGRERQVIEALHSSRERQDAREQRPSNGADHTSLPPVYHREPFPMTSAEEYPGPQSPNVTSGHMNTQRVLREYLQERHVDRNVDRDSNRTPNQERQRARVYEPRRRSSVILSHHEPHPPSAMRELPARASFTTSPPRLPAQTDSPDPWQTIEAAMAARSREDGGTRPRRERTDETEIDIQPRDDIHVRLDPRRRDRQRSLSYEVEGIGTGRYEHGVLLPSEMDDGLPTTGCAMSEDGRKLYIGTEEGILELHVNIQGRRFFPQITPR